MNIVMITLRCALSVAVPEIPHFVPFLEVPHVNLICIYNFVIEEL